jgi:hypothetical protein
MIALFTKVSGEPGPGQACRSEWRLITATHNLLKLFRHQTALAAA